MQSVEPDVDSTKPSPTLPSLQWMLGRQIKLFVSKYSPVHPEQGFAYSEPYQDTQQPEAESDFTLQTRNTKMKINEALILNICPFKNKTKKLKKKPGGKCEFFLR